MKNIFVIGAGMAGLTAARILHQSGFQVTVLDKGRGFGGRMATRRLGKARVDYGAQYFSAKTDDFQKLVYEARESDVLRKWMPSHLVDGHPRWVGADGMTRFPKFLAEGLEVKRRTKVVKLASTATGWGILTEEGAVFSADAVLATMPAPQALELLNNSNLDLSETKAELGKIEYAPCLAVLARLDRPTTLTSVIPHEFDEKHPIAWLANNQAKGITGQPSITIHATPEFSRKHLDGNLQAAGEILLNVGKPFVEPAQITEWQIHRWRYSLAVGRHPEKYWEAETNSPLLFGGDGFGIGNVEGAFLSGQAMAERMMKI